VERRGTGVDVARAVEVALATDPNDFKKGNGLNAEFPVKEAAAVRKTAAADDRRRLQDQDSTGAPFRDYTITVVAFGPMLQPIGEAVREIDFRNALAKHLRDGLGKYDVLEPEDLRPIIVPNKQGSGGRGVDGAVKFTSAVYERDEWPELPESSGGKRDTGQTVGDVSQATSIGLPTPTESKQTANSDELSGGIIFLIVLLCLCCLWPIFCCCFARFKYGAGKEMLWMRFLFSHSNPTLPLFYMPREDRENLRKQLYAKTPKAADDEHTSLDDEAPAAKDRV
jgi:hypothetical protein